MIAKGKFFATGKGLLYCFKVGEYRVIYDIGSERNIFNSKILATELESFFGGKKIDILLISHFHKDHIAGVKYLHDNEFDIDKILIPYMSDDELLYVNLRYFIKKLKNQNKKDNISFEPNSDLESDIKRFYPNVQKWEDNDEKPVLFEEKWEFYFLQSEWQPSKELDKLMDKLHDVGIDNLNDLKKHFFSKVRIIEGIYKDVFKSRIHKTCLFMIHGPKSNDIVLSMNKSGALFLDKLATNDNSLVCYHSFIGGDMDFTTNKSKLIPFQSKIRYALTPHHSSPDEWEPYFCSNNIDVNWIVTLGKIDKRPYGKVVQDIYSNNQVLYYVDNKEIFYYEFHI